MGPAGRREGGKRKSETGEGKRGRPGRECSDFVT